MPFSNDLFHPFESAMMSLLAEFFIFALAIVARDRSARYFT
jgi:hypothetical protein